MSYPSKMRAAVPPAELRARFAAALSDMYRAEVPQYGALLDLVAAVNRETLVGDAALVASLTSDDELARIDAERHGAIRLGTAAELAAIARAFRLLGMMPVSYYDLAAAGIPVHSTAFRPIEAAELAASPFRIFTSLLRLELIDDAALRKEAQAMLAGRQILTGETLRLMGKAEAANGLDEAEADRFVTELLETFRWHGRATITEDVYERFLASHRLVADVVSFPGPHINHLTPRTLDIDAAHARMAALGFAPKEMIEGPPRRAVPVLLRQTSFKALSEPVRFLGQASEATGSHTARFGEIEQRGMALTPAGRRLYDSMIAGDASPALPDDAEALRREGYGYFRYLPTDTGARTHVEGDLEALIAKGAVVPVPITYEDFLPVSAAGIFRSNLGDDARAASMAAGVRATFEAALGEPVRDAFVLYEREQAASLRSIERTFGWRTGSARTSR